MTIQRPHPTAAAPAASAEIELKLALPGADPRTVGEQMAQLPLLADLAPVQQKLRNIYFDTPAQDLRQQRAALRLRSLRQGSGKTRWLQTLKTAVPVDHPASHSAHDDEPDDDDLDDALDSFGC